MEWWILAVIVLAVMALIANVADIETTVACARKFGADGEANLQGRNLMADLSRQVNLFNLFRNIL